MLRFIDYLTLLESKVDDLEQQNPNIPVRQYANVDNTPTKKFLPWLVKQHKLGNVTPDHPDLVSTLGNFDKYKSKHGITDHTQHSFQELVNAVKPHIGTAATNKEKQKQEVDTGVEILHKEPNGITAQHIKTKEASQNMYGGGNERGGPKGGARGTSWCVSARSKDCLFGSKEYNYGKMYTIHDPNDDNAPYAVHPQKGTITSRYNDGDISIDDVLRRKPHLTTAVSKIHSHFSNTLPNKKRIPYKFENDYGSLTTDDINDGLKHKDGSIRRAAINHPNADADHITYVLTHENEKTDPDGSIRSSTFYHPDVTTDHITHVITHENNETDPYGKIRREAMNHSTFNADHITYILTHKNNETDPYGDMRLFAIGHNKTNDEHITHVLTHYNNETDPYGKIRREAMIHYKVNDKHLNYVLKNYNEETDPGGYMRDVANRSLVKLKNKQKK